MQAHFEPRKPSRWDFPFPGLAGAFAGRGGQGMCPSIGGKSEQAVDERRQGRAFREHKQSAQEHEKQDDRGEPPFLALAQEHAEFLDDCQFVHEAVRLVTVSIKSRAIGSLPAGVKMDGAGIQVKRVSERLPNFAIQCRHGVGMELKKDGSVIG
jgi:hypothetical protein